VEQVANAGRFVSQLAAGRFLGYLQAPDRGWFDD